MGNEEERDAPSAAETPRGRIDPRRRDARRCRHSRACPREERRARRRAHSRWSGGRCRWRRCSRSRRARGAGDGALSVNANRRGIRSKHASSACFWSEDTPDFARCFADCGRFRRKRRAHASSPRSAHVSRNTESPCPTTPQIGSIPTTSRCTASRWRRCSSSCEQVRLGRPAAASGSTASRRTRTSRELAHVPAQDPVGAQQSGGAVQELEVLGGSVIDRLHVLT